MPPGLARLGRPGIALHHRADRLDDVTSGNTGGSSARGALSRTTRQTAVAARRLFNQFEADFQRIAFMHTCVRASERQDDAPVLLLFGLPAPAAQRAVRCPGLFDFQEKRPDASKTWDQVSHLDKSKLPQCEVMGAPQAKAAMLATGKRPLTWFDIGRAGRRH
jgi:hypothetical protein